MRYFEHNNGTTTLKMQTGDNLRVELPNGRIITIEADDHHDFTQFYQDGKQLDYQLMVKSDATRPWMDLVLVTDELLTN